MKAFSVLLVIGLLVLAGCSSEEKKYGFKYQAAWSKHSYATIYWYDDDNKMIGPTCLHVVDCDTIPIRFGSGCSDSIMIVTTWVDTTIIFDECIKRVPDAW